METTYLSLGPIVDNKPIINQNQHEHDGEFVNGTQQPILNIKPH